LAHVARSLLSFMSIDTACEASSRNCFTTAALALS